VLLCIASGKLQPVVFCLRGILLCPCVKMTNNVFSRFCKKATMSVSVSSPEGQLFYYLLWVTKH
jgi:hypothetical protein